MGSKSKQTKQDIPAIAKTLQSIEHTLSMLVKLYLWEIQGKRKLNEIILFLHALGYRPRDIVKALGKTPNDVNPVISRARKENGKRKKLGQDTR
jgi:hypothetical protein